MVVPRSFYGSKPSNLVQTIERMSLIFEELRLSPQGLSIKDLSERVALPKGTTHRLLKSLAYFGFVGQDVESKQYHLGFKLVELGNTLLSQLDLRTLARPHLITLSQTTNETVHLVIFDQEKVLYLDKVESEENPSSLRMASTVGMRISAHSCAVGKVLLAALPKKELREFTKAKDLPRKTKKTITDADQFIAHLELVRTQGYAIDDEENEPGIRCVAAPIWNEMGHVVAAISISAPTIRISRKMIQEKLKNQVMDTALEISRKLGFQEEKIS
jgi:DNA-binding IclR family transcriptional regulator